jgi:hypothetical protein
VASVAFSVVEHADDERTAILANGRGFLTYWVPRGRDVVVLLRLVWVGDGGG